MQYHIQDEVIKEVKYAKYLGVIIDHHLSWNDHINYITSKANNVKCFLQRNLSRCSTRIKSNCYQSIVRPILEYACTVWAPHTQKNILAIEAVQRRAARYATNNYSRYASVSDMLTYLQWPTLNDRREKLKIIMLYKIMQQLVEIPRTNLIPALDYYCTRGYNTKYIQPFARTDTYYYSFFPSTIRTWNSLQEDFCNIRNLQTLKSMKKYFFYSFTRQFIGFKVPIAIQNVYLREYAKRNEIEFSLAFPEEPGNGSYKILKDIINRCKQDDCIVTTSLFILEDIREESNINYDIRMVGVLENKEMTIGEALKYIDENKELGTLSMYGELS